MTLQTLLSRLQSDYHRTGYLTSDPLEFVHRFSDPWDQEAVALLGALLAYGNVKQIRRSVEDALARMQGLAASPREFVRGLGTSRGRMEASRAFGGFVHRFNRGADVVLLFRLLARSWERHGSLGAHFVAGLEPEAEDFAAALDRLADEWRAWARELDRKTADASFSYLLTAPRDGSCCKRWCMFLRWMGRKDELDPGLWARGGALAGTFPRGRCLQASQLVIPLDTHTGRISQYLALTERKSLNWLAAVEVTRNLKACDPEDPTRYDFALARLGILDLCQRRYRSEICGRCQLLPACRFAQSSLRAQERAEKRRRSASAPQPGRAGARARA